MSNNVWTGENAVLRRFFMSSGIPCVCSAVGMNKEIIVDGINGYLADTEDEGGKLSLLIDSAIAKNRAAGRRTLKKIFCSG